MPVATTCGLFFCRSCLNKAFEFKGSKRGHAQFAERIFWKKRRRAFNRIGAPAEPTPEAANSKIPIPSAGNRGRAARTPMTARSSLLCKLVQNYLEEENEHIHHIQLTLSRHVSDLRGERIRELEQLVENLVQMNLAVLREMEDRDHDRRRLSRRIAELENPTMQGASAFARRQRRVGRRIMPTPIAAIAAGNEEAGPESVESRLQ